MEWLFPIFWRGLCTVKFTALPKLLLGLRLHLPGYRYRGYYTKLDSENFLRK